MNSIQRILANWFEQWFWDELIVRCTDKPHGLASVGDAAFATPRLNDAKTIALLRIGEGKEKFRIYKEALPSQRL
jgi:hypothetical protein